MGNRVFGVLRNLRRGAGLLVSGLYQQYRQGLPGSQRFSKPTLLYFLTNDAREAGCIPCNNRRQQVREVISLDAMRDILDDPLFQKVRQVNLAVWESTLRPNTKEIGAILVKKLPALETVQLVTNATDTEQAWKQIDALQEVLQLGKKRLVVEVSLGGVGETQDVQRYPSGYFENDVQFIRYLKKQDILLSVQSTLTPLNCYYADDMLLLLEQEGIEDYAFRIAVENARFHKTGYPQRYAFSSEQRFHTLMFFEKLSRQREFSLKRRLYYKRIVSRLSLNPSQAPPPDSAAPAVTLDMHGDLRYCPAQKEPIGSALEKSAWQVYKHNLGSRKNTLREECDDQDDIWGELTLPEIIYRGREVASALYRHRRNRIRTDRIIPQSIQPPSRGHPNLWRHVLITGWYGTETAGDKAILGEVLYFLKTHAPGCRLTLTTLNCNVSQQMQPELTDLHGVVQVDIAQAHDPALIETVDAVIIGGGPLMESQAMEHIWRIFAEANRQRKARIVFGCGVGPLHTEHITRLTAAVLQMATAGFFRDRESRDRAARLAPDCSFGYACDPAFAYVRRWAANGQAQTNEENDSERIVGLLRANTNEFIPGQSKNELLESNREAARQLANALEMTCLNAQTRAVLLHMNAPWPGGDDRLFNRQVAGFFEDPGLVDVARNYLSLDGLLHALHTAGAAVAMRYHAHIFCMALGIPFLSIDYTGKGGKVNGLIQRIGYEGWSEDWKTIEVDRGAKRLQNLLAARDHWAGYLQKQADCLIDELHRTYSQVFQVPVMDKQKPI